MSDHPAPIPSENAEFRTEHDSMGEVQVPRDALWRAQTQRAIENFPISGTTLEPRLVHALGLVKGAAARVNGELGILTAEQSSAIQDAAAAVAADAEHIRSQLVHAWHAQRGGAATAARVLWAGPGRLGVHRGAYQRAAGELTAWAQAWRPLLPAMPTDPQRIAEIAGRSDYPLHPGAAFTAAGRTQAEAAHPEHARLLAAAAAATAAAEAAWSVLADARREDADRAARFGDLADAPDPAARLAAADRELAVTREQLADIRMSVATLQAEPVSRTRRVDQSAGRPAGQPTDEPAGWRSYRHLDRHRPRPAPKQPPAPERHLSHPRPEDLRDLGYLQHRPGPGRGISR